MYDSLHDKYDHEFCFIVVDIMIAEYYPYIFAKFF